MPASCRFLVREWAVNPYGARLVSFLAAATTTWSFNRKYTFAGKSGGSRRRELFRYIVAMAGGFALNYGAYAACVARFGLVREWPAIGVAAGSIAGAVVNFLTLEILDFPHPERRARLIQTVLRARAPPSDPIKPR